MDESYIHFAKTMKPDRKEFMTRWKSQNNRNGKQPVVVKGRGWRRS